MVQSHRVASSPVAGNRHLTVELVQTVQDVQSLRSVQPLRSVFSDVLNGLNALNVLNQAYPLLSLQCVMLFPRTVNHLGLDIFLPRSSLMILQTVPPFLQPISLSSQPCPNTSR
jgi:hypothetical protein